MAETEDPGLLHFHETAFTAGEARGAVEQRRQPAPRVEPGEGFAGHTDLGAVENLVPSLASVDLLPEKGGVDFGKDKGCTGRAQTGLERPDFAAALDAPVRVQALDGRQAQQHLRADGTGIGQLPYGLGPTGTKVGDPAFGRVPLPTGTLPSADRYIRQGVPLRRTLPERVCTWILPIDLRRDLVAVVGVVLRILDPIRQPSQSSRPEALPVRRSATPTG